MEEIEDSREAAVTARRRHEDMSQVSMKRLPSCSDACASA
jgi:hypothetical protein